MAEQQYTREPKLTRPKITRPQTSHPKITRPRWRAEFCGPFEAYARRFAAENHWRVRRVFPDYDDVFAECRAIFCRCAALYEATVDNGAWFMSLYKTALFNDFNSLARKNSRYLRVEQAAAEHARETTRMAHSLGPLVAAIQRASPELKQALAMLCTARQPLAALLLPVQRLALDSEAEVNPAEPALSRSWCRLARTRTIRSDLISELRALLA